MTIEDVATIKMQISMNKRMLEQGRITYDVYSQVNRILLIRLESDRGEP